MVSLDEEREIVYHSIKSDIKELAFHQKGNYVLISCLLILKPDHFKQVIEEIMEYFHELVMDQYGICIINKIIALASEQQHKERIIELLNENIIEIVQNAYGNYAITEVLQRFSREVNKPIVCQLAVFFQQLSVQRYSTNVIEKCVERAD